MERFLVGFMALALLSGGAGHSRAGYQFVYQSDGPPSGGGRFLNLFGVRTGLSEDGLFAAALDYRGRLFIVTNLASLSGGDRGFFEPAGTGSGNIVPNDPLNVRPGQSESDLAFLAESGCLGRGSHFTELFGVERALAKDIYGADTLIQRNEMSSGDDQFLAKLGGFGIGPAETEPARVALDLAGSGFVTALLLEHKLAWGLSLLGIGGLATLAYVLRQRRAAPRRGLRGPRGTAIYRSSTSTNPRGTVR
jgi:hypothetical protein